MGLDRKTWSDRHAQPGGHHAQKLLVIIGLEYDARCESCLTAYPPEYRGNGMRRASNPWIVCHFLKFYDSASCQSMS